MQLNTLRHRVANVETFYATIQLCEHFLSFLLLFRRDTKHCAGLPRPSTANSRRPHYLDLFLHPLEFYREYDFVSPSHAGCLTNILVAVVQQERDTTHRAQPPPVPLALPAPPVQTVSARQTLTAPSSPGAAASSARHVLLLALRSRSDVCACCACRGCLCWFSSPCASSR